MNHEIKCRWLIPMEIEMHSVEFQQNMETTKASLMVDKKIQYVNISKLCREERFAIGKHLLIISYNPSRHDPIQGNYELTIDGQPFPDYREQQNKRYARWSAHQSSQHFHIVYDKTTMDVYVNAHHVPSEHEFVGPDTVVSFELELREGHRVPCRIVTPGGLIVGGPAHILYVRDESWPLVIDQNTGVFPARQAATGILTDY